MTEPYFNGEPAARRSALKQFVSVLPNLTKLGWRLVRDGRVPVKNRALAVAALGYIVTPVDLVPDFIPIVGSIDDVLVLALALHHLFEAAGDEIVEEHWDGSGNALELVTGILDWGASLVPWPVRRLVKRFLGRS